MATDRVKNPAPTNLIGPNLREMMKAYGMSDGDLAPFMGMTANGINRWKHKSNGIKHMNCEKLAFLFGCSLDDLTAPEEYRSPQKPERLDKKAFASSVIELAPDCKNKLFRTDVTLRAHKFLGTNQRVAKDFKELPDMLAGSLPGPSNSCDARPYTQGERQAVAERPPVTVPANPDANAIRLFLHQANTFAKNNDLQWTIREDGSLGAKRVQVEEF